MASERRTCQKPACHRKFSRPLGSRRVYCEGCSPPRKPKVEPVLLPGGGQRGPGDVEAATGVELSAAGREGSPDGVVSLRLARLIDAGQYTAQGAAALVKAHAESMIRALQGAARQADVVDDLLERRRARRSG